MREISLNQILADFNVPGSGSRVGSPDRQPITIWVKPDLRDRYKQLQKDSRKDFGQRVRATIEKLIELAESKRAAG